MDDTIKKSDAIKAIAEYFSDDDDSHWNAIATYIIKDIPSVEKQGENATRCYEFLKIKLGEDIVDSKKEFESWYERMVWHVKECDKLAREPKQGEWIITEQDNGHKWTHRKCSECGKGIIEPLGVSRMNFCPNCGADMRKGERVDDNC